MGGRNDDPQSHFTLIGGNALWLERGIKEPKRPAFDTKVLVATTLKSIGKIKKNPGKTRVLSEEELKEKQRRAKNAELLAKTKRSDRRRRARQVAVVTAVARSMIDSFR